MIVLALLVAAIYSSSAYFVSAEIVTIKDPPKEPCPPPRTNCLPPPPVPCYPYPMCMPMPDDDRVMTEGDTSDTRNDTKVPRDELLEGGALSPGNDTDTEDDVKVPNNRGELDEDGLNVN